LESGRTIVASEPRLARVALLGAGEGAFRFVEGVFDGVVAVGHVFGKAFEELGLLSLGYVKSLRCKPWKPHAR
jgi:hypothetical protein